MLGRDRDARICLSMHRDAPEYLEKLRPVFGLLQSRVQNYGVQVEHYQSFRNWTTPLPRHRQRHTALAKLGALPGEEIPAAV